MPVNLFGGHRQPGEHGNRKTGGKTFLYKNVQIDQKGVLPPRIAYTSMTYLLDIFGKSDKTPNELGAPIARQSYSQMNWLF